MSFWNRLGKLATDIGGAVLSPAKFVWDIASSPWNDDAHFNGIANTLANATKNLGGSLVAPVSDVAQLPGISEVVKGINWVNQNVVREPLTTAALVWGDMLHGKGSFFDPSEWSKAYEGAQNISFGQAAAYNLKVGPNDLNIYDPAQRDAAFKKSTFGRYVSGTFDFATQIFGDVTIVGGKAAKIAKASEFGVGAIRTADDAAKAAEDITKAASGQTNRFTKVINDFTANDSTYALNHPMVKSSHEPGLLANLLGQADTPQLTAKVLRSALGDPVAKAQLMVERADMQQALNKANQELDAIDKFKIGSGVTVDPVTGQARHVWEDSAVVEEAKAAIRAAGANNTYVNKLLNLSEGGGVLTRTTGTTLQGVEDFIAKARAARFYDKPTGKPIISFFQETPFHRMYQVISHAEHERPAGLVDVNDPNSYQEIVATIDRSRKLTGLDEATSKAHLDNYIAQSTPEGRTQSAIVLEQDSVKRIAAKYKLTEQQAMDLWSEYNDARKSATNKIKEETFMVDVDGSIIKAPVFESQTSNFHAMMDLDLLDRVLKRNASSIAVLGRTKDTIVHYADVTQDLFKAAALLRGGYTIRNGIDSQLRIMASLGAMASVRHFGEGMKNMMLNKIPTPTRMTDGYKFLVGKNVKAEQLVKSAKSVTSEITELESRIADLRKTIEVNPQDAQAIGEMGALKLLLGEKQVIASHYSTVANRIGQKGGKLHLGDGVIEHVTSDGRKYILPDAFGGPLGDMFRQLNSSSTTFQRLVDTNSDLLGRKLASKGIGSIKPGDKLYHEEWANTLNTDFANSAGIRMLAKGDKPAAVANWMKHDPEGMKIRQRLQIKYGDVDEEILRWNGFLDKYLPETYQGLRDKLARREAITADDLRTATADLKPDELPVVHGNVIKENLNNNTMISARSITDKLFKWLGSMPEDAWARHPLYRDLYRDEMKRRLDIMEGLKKDRLTPAEQEEIMGKAHKFAQQGVKKILFNIERRTNLATSLKYISPFFSAQENAVKTWLRLAADSPVIVNRGNLIWTAPNRAGLVTDQDGNPVPAGKEGPNDVIWLEMPNWTKRIPIIGSGLQSLNMQGIPKQSLDVIFGGGMSAVYGNTPTVPFNDVIPVGPFVATPVSELVKKMPQFEDVMKWALPFGPNQGSIISGLMPAWMKRAQTLIAGQSSPEYVRAYQLIHTTEMHKARDAGLPMPSDAKIKTMTDDYFKMRITANLIMPYSPRFDSPYKLYLDKYRQYQRQYGINADTQYLKDFGPSFFDFATSLSSNKTGVQATQSAYANTQKYKDLISEVYKDEPGLVALITNTKGNTAFSQAVYDWQYNTPVGPGSSDTFRSNANANDAQNQNQIKLGWIQYRNVMNQVDAILKNRGLTSITQRGAEDLKMIKSALVDTLAYQQNPDGTPMLDKGGQPVVTPWYEAYLDPKGSKTLKVVAGLNKITNDPKFWTANKDNPTWKAVKTYLQMRQQLSGILANRKAKSITAKANADIAAIYDSMVQVLKDGDIQFGDIYDRYLGQDQVYYAHISQAAQGA